MAEELIDREKECMAITDLISRNKNIFIYGMEGVGKTAIVSKVLSSHRNVSMILYSGESSTLKDALKNILSSNYGVHANIGDKNILELKKMCYPILDTKPEYIIFDHMGYSTPKYSSFLEYLLERKLPLIVISRGTKKKDIGHLHFLLNNFEKIEISNFDKTKTDLLVDHYVNEFGIKAKRTDSFKKEIFRFSNGNPKMVRQLCSLARHPKYHKNDFIDVRLMDLDRRIGYGQGDYT
ncbi:MAG: hypothetical protein NC938_05310 [Candidatus Omnitrophica bacterium]|nr:hypothetical protein [Candidatus Omnitrophota bacterium]MCM8791099.1 hypothetical protein [Candidatus Omnitrophota bacterium]